MHNFLHDAKSFHAWNQNLQVAGCESTNYSCFPLFFTEVSSDFNYVQKVIIVSNHISWCSLAQLSWGKQFLLSFQHCVFIYSNLMNSSVQFGSVCDDVIGECLLPVCDESQRNWNWTHLQKANIWEGHLCWLEPAPSSWVTAKWARLQVLNGQGLKWVSKITVSQSCELVKHHEWRPKYQSPQLAKYRWLVL